MICLCSWHAKRAVGKYLVENQQSSWASKHAPLNYVDPGRSWDANKLLDSLWIIILNQETENAFRNHVIVCNRNIDNAHEMETKILEMRKTQVCVSEKEN
jgi:hypothetical protein